MKALSIKQPWAWAITALPEPYRKNVENRSRKTNYRGPFLVHASLGFDEVGYQRMLRYLHELKYGGPVPAPDEFVRGAVVGISEIIDCSQKFYASRWFEGPFGYVLQNSRAFAKPFSWKGMLGFWEFPDEKLPGDFAEMTAGAGKGEE